MKEVVERAEVAEARKVVEVDLSSLYEVAPTPKARACDLLKALLEAWGLKYRLLANMSPDIDVEFFDEEFRRFYRAAERAHVHGAVEEDDIVGAFAEREGAKAVRLFDGYEWAYALVFPQ